MQYGSLTSVCTTWKVTIPNAIKVKLTDLAKFWNCCCESFVFGKEKLKEYVCESVWKCSTVYSGKSEIS